MMIFYLVCFTFSISYSVLTFHLVYALQLLEIFFFFLFFDALSQVFIKCSRKKLLYTYIKICIIYILESL